MDRKALATSLALCALVALSLSAAQMKKTTPSQEPEMHLFIDIYTEGSMGVPQTSSDRPALFKILQDAKLLITPSLYKIDTTNLPETVTPSQFIQAVTEAFGTWDQEVTANLFEYDPSAPADTILDWPAPWGPGFDFSNDVFFKDLRTDPYLSEFYPDVVDHIIAITLTWFMGPGSQGSGGGFHYAYIFDFDMAFNTGVLDGVVPWSTQPLSGQRWDVKEIALHEAGHTLFLDDLYMDAARGQTMYGYGVPAGYKGHLPDHALGNGDILGVRTLYREARE